MDGSLRAWLGISRMRDKYEKSRRRKKEETSALTEVDSHVSLPNILEYVAQGNKEEVLKTDA